MSLLHIAALSPELPARETQQFKAVVTLIWPYSSSTRRFALLLAEPDLHLRRRKGQVRVRFSGSSAKAIATTGVGIGDEVTLSLQGAQFVQDSAVSTPGKSIAWELEYAQTLAVQISRDGRDLASLQLDDVAPTPAPQSPVRQQRIGGPRDALELASPAFLKRARISDGPVFPSPYDPLAPVGVEGHDRKRRRKSYRDWKDWTYSARTPSPEKFDETEDFDEEMLTPIRPTELPKTPISIPSPDKPVAEQPVEIVESSEDEASVEDLESFERDNSDEEAEVIESGMVEYPTLPGQAGVNIQDDLLPKVALPSGRDDFVRDADYYELYAGPDEHPPLDIRSTSNDVQEEDAQETVDAVEQPSRDQTDVVLSESSNLEVEAQEDVPPQSIHDDLASIPSAKANQENIKLLIEPVAHVEDEAPDMVLYPRLDLENVMAPPALPTLDTTMPSLSAPVLLTPIGREPASPTLQPLDSSTLPLPSPFPGERDNAATSYLDYVATNANANKTPEPVDKENDLPDEADYIIESSFYSSINSSRASNQHPEHESAFTPVRFTFGFDGAGLSRMVRFSSPRGDVEENKAGEDEPSRADLAIDDVSKDATIDDFPNYPIEASHHEDHVASVMHFTSSDPPDENQGPQDDSLVASRPDADLVAHPSPKSTHSDVDDVETQIQVEVDRAFAEAARLENQTSPHTAFDDLRGTQKSAGTEIVDLGSPSEEDSNVEEESPARTYEYDQAEDVLHENAANIEAKPSSILDKSVHSDTQGHDSVQTTVDVDSFHDFFAAAAPPEWTDFINDPPENELMTAPQQQVPQTQQDDHKTPPHDIDVSHEPFVQSDLEWQNVQDRDKAFNDSWIDMAFDDSHPDIKMESIENELLHDVPQFHANEPQKEEGQMLIDIPESGHRVGELQTVAVPASGPARNTRSKAKETMSPVDGDPFASQRTARSGRSGATATPVAQTTLSPSGARIQSTQSPPQSASQTSPYNLRSKSRILSPTKSTSVSVAKSHRRKPSGRHSVESLPDADGTQLSTRETQMQSFQPSQELGLSQGRYSNVSFVQDSEESSIRSEHSLSTLDSDDSTARPYRNMSEPMDSLHGPPDPANLEPPSASAPQPSTKARMSGTIRRTQPQVVILSSSSPAREAKSPTATPGRRLRSAMSVEAPSPSTQRHTRRRSLRLSIGSEVASEDTSEKPVSDSKRTVKEKPTDVAHPVLSNEGEDDDATPRPASAHGSIPSSPPATGPDYSLNQYSAVDSNRPLTPDPTQKTEMGSQAMPTNAHEQQHTLPMTPQLTQATSANLRSFETDPLQTLIPPSPQTKRLPSTPTRSSPRPAKSILKSPQFKPFSSDASSSPPRTTSPPPEVRPVSPSKEAYLNSPPTQSQIVPSSPQLPPSIGLSTPLSYYTPLRDLPYFLNRASQSHTAAANPDILALVVQSTSSHTRAPKGPKDWTTSLRITDLSTFPATTTVNVFRPFAGALPHADAGDVILLRSFTVLSVKGKPMLRSGDESAWCVWRWQKPIWGRKRGRWGEIRAREEVRGPEVERGEGEWSEVGRLRGWWEGTVSGEVGKEGKGEVNGVEEGKTGDVHEKAEVENDGQGLSEKREERSVRME